MRSPYRPRRSHPPEVAEFLELLRRHPADVLDGLRRVILGGAAPPGLAVPPEDVAAVFGVSVIPVREALKTPVGEGLVEHPPAAATRWRLTAAELHELYLVRGVPERAALGAAVARAGAADHERARTAHDTLDQALRDGDERGYHRESRRFHLALVAPAGMLRLQASRNRRGTSPSPTARWRPCPARSRRRCTRSTSGCSRPSSTDRRPSSWPAPRPTTTT